MTADQLWPEEARAAVHEVLLDTGSPWVAREALTDAVLAALSVHAVPRAAILNLAQQWEDLAEVPDSAAEWFAAELRELGGGDQ